MVSLYDAAANRLTLPRPLASLFLRLRKRGRHDQRKYDRRLSVHLDAVAIHPNLSPAYRLVRPRSCVAPVKLLRRVDIHCAFRAVAHQVRIRDVMLHNAAAQDDHPRALRPDGDGVDLADVLDNVYAQLLRARLERVEVQHVAQGAVRQRRAKDGDVVFPRPVIYRALVVDLLTKAVDHLAGRPVDGFFVIAASLLLCEHSVHDRHDPIFEGAVVAVRHDQVADAVHALGA